VTDSQFDGYTRQASLANQASGFQPLPCPLITSGLPANVVQQLGAAVSPFGLTAVGGIGAGSSTAAGSSADSYSATGDSKGAGVPQAASSVDSTTNSEMIINNLSFFIFTSPVFYFFCQFFLFDDYFRYICAPPLILSNL